MKSRAGNQRRKRPDPVSIALYAELLASVAEEMGEALRRSAFSPNVKERRDYSCAVFLGDGEMAAQAAHIPVHLGSAQLSVLAALAAAPLGPGDEVILNDPFRGGTHLPDVTLVRPVYLGAGDRPDFLVANRAHHADIGGASPGSMGIAEDIHGEGFRIPPVTLVKNGELVGDVLALFRAQVRQPDEREGDLRAQMAANHVGAERLAELATEHGLAPLLSGARELPRATARAMADLLATLPQRVVTFRDRMDGDGRTSNALPIQVSVRIAGRRAEVDFTGTADQVRGPVNANLAVTRSAVAYAFRCLLGADVPQNGGILDPITIKAPAGSIVNARAPAAVAGGNVETSQRIVDVVLGALARLAPRRLAAASAGTMTNVSLGGEGFTYYETVAGGSGASSRAPGASAVQTHMTNTLNTPIEMLEAACPLRVLGYAVRRRSGGTGQRRGGDGVVRRIRALAPMTATVLADRQAEGPYGLAGGGPGTPGETFVLVGPRRRRLPAKVTLQLAPGDQLEVRTPGGGGHGRPGGGR